MPREQWMRPHQDSAAREDQFLEIKAIDLNFLAEIDPEIGRGLNDLVQFTIAWFPANIIRVSPPSVSISNTGSIASRRLNTVAGVGGVLVPAVPPAANHTVVLLIAEPGEAVGMKFLRPPKVRNGFPLAPVVSEGRPYRMPSSIALAWSNIFLFLSFDHGSPVRANVSVTVPVNSYVSLNIWVKF